ncbi:hypothetical protein GLOIN_2v1483931 [Rhizophagus irregularis DAOM 181602=DAOM 197198]|nr:hypothetical protein GLOIN_2v1483931 [Rhizophagus irregularis DAOM 181602=DAOM 197198]
MQDELIGDSRKCGYRMTQVAGQTPNHNNELSKDEEQIEESSPSLLGMKVPSKKQSANEDKERIRNNSNQKQPKACRVSTG